MKSQTIALRLLYACLLVGNFCATLLLELAAGTASFMGRWKVTMLPPSSSRVCPEQPRPLCIGVSFSFFGKSRGLDGFSPWTCQRAKTKAQSVLLWALLC